MRGRARDAEVRDADWHRAARTARWLAWASLAWMCTEGGIGLWQGLAAGSIALTGWALGSAIEGLASVIVIWRFTGSRTLSGTAEHRAQRAVGISFWLLAPYIAAESVHDLVTGHHADTTVIGIALTAVALLEMPLLGRAKHKLALRLGSAATAGEGTRTICARPRRQPSCWAWPSPPYGPAPGGWIRPLAWASPPYRCRRASVPGAATTAASRRSGGGCQARREPPDPVREVGQGRVEALRVTGRDGVRHRPVHRRQLAEFLVRQVAHGDDQVAVLADVAEMTRAQPGQGQLVPPGRVDRPGRDGSRPDGCRLMRPGWRWPAATAQRPDGSGRSWRCRRTAPVRRRTRPGCPGWPACRGPAAGRCGGGHLRTAGG